MNGTGTSSDPYIISTVSDLRLLEGTGYGDYHGSDVYFELANDIDFHGASFAGIGDTSETTYYFNGHFDGNSHWIRNMYMTGGNRVGFFKVLNGTVTVHDLKFFNCHLTGTSICGILTSSLYAGVAASVTNIETDRCTVSTTGGYAGGVIGYVSESASNTVTFDNIYVHDGSVIASTGSHIGGICGIVGYKSNSNYVLLENSRVEYELIYAMSSEKGQYAGGIAGRGSVTSYSVTIDNCSVLSSWIGTDANYAGGIMGLVGSSMAYTLLCSNCSVTDCTINCGGKYAGGIAGNIYLFGLRLLTNSVTNCTCFAANYAGGAIGYLVGDSTTTYSVTVANLTLRNNCILSTSTASGFGKTYKPKVTMSGTNTQDANNVYSASGSYGANITGYTNQTALNQYLIADGVTASVSGNMVTFTFSNLRGSCVDSENNLAVPGKAWQYRYPASSNSTESFALSHLYRKAGTYSPKVTLTNSLSYASPVTVQVASAVVISADHPGTGNHDQSLRDKIQRKTHGMHVAATNHDESFYEMI